MPHICDNRCRNEDSGHHAWPSPGEDECLCDQRVSGQKVWCPVHAKAQSLAGPDKTLRCAFCGHEYPEGTPTHKHESLVVHIRECPDHPVGKENRKFRELLRCIAAIDPKDISESELRGYVRSAQKLVPDWRS